jgi:ATP-binding cassette, subfamily B, bacterial MsbA
VTAPRPAIKTLFGRFWRDFLSRRPVALAVALVLMAGVAALAASYGWVVQWATRLIEQRDADIFWKAPLVIVGVVLARSVLLYFQTVQTHGLCLRMAQDLQSKMFGRLVRLDLAQIQSAPSGGYIARFTSDIQSIRDGLARALSGLVRDLLTVVACLVSMVLIDWVLGLAVLLAYPLVAGPLAAIAKRARRAGAAFQEQAAALSARLGESFSSPRLIKTYGLEDYEQNRADEAFEDQRKITLKLVRNRAHTEPVMEAAGGLALAGVFALVGWRIISGEAGFADFTAFLTTLAMAGSSARSLGTLNTALFESAAALERCYDVIDATPEIKDAPGAKPLKLSAAKLEFQNVGFAYGPEAPAIKAVSFTSQRGRMTALVGASGAGKSTAFNLILRLYETSGGSIEIDGQNIKTVTLDSLRANIALVSQDAQMFDDTIAANIAFGKPGATPSEIESAAKAAAAHAFISSMPEKYATRVGERGNRLSGGERQRVALSRAILRGAPILLLDEATSALDAETEAQIDAALQKLRPDHTLIVIAHRLSTVRHADEILVFDDGQIVERGTHQSLVEKGGVYAGLVKLQFGAGAAS